MWLFIIFIFVPLIEIVLFIKVGGWLTLWPTLAIVFGTGILGTALVRRQGRQVLRELQGSLRTMRDPVSPLAHGAMIVLAGVLLVTPGFFTDALGFALLIPALRRAVMRAVAARLTVVTATGGRPPPQAKSDVIDAEYTDVTVDQRREPGQKPSGWTEH